MTYWAIDKIPLLELPSERVYRDYDEKHHVNTYHHHDNEKQHPVFERLHMRIVFGRSAPIYTVILILSNERKLLCIFLTCISLLTLFLSLMFLKM